MIKTAMKKGSVDTDIISKGIDGFSARLAKVIDSLGTNAHAASHLISERTGISAATIRSHYLGTRVPRARVSDPRSRSLEDYAELYACALGVDKEWLVHGEKLSKINQLTGGNANIPSVPEDFRRIPVITTTYPTGHGLMETIPFPTALGAAPASFIWQICEGDFAMVGKEYNLSPGTYVVVEPDAEILPGQLILCIPNGFSEKTIRVYKGGVPLGVAKNYELLAANPLFDALKIKTTKACQVFGRIRFSINQW